MDQLLRGTVYVCIGLVLLFCNLSYVRALLALRSDRFTILPIRAVRTMSAEGKDTKASAADGVALAQLLQARIQSIEKEMNSANEVLLSPPLRVPNASEAQSGFAPDVISLISPLDPVRLPTAVLSPTDVKIAVSGVEVGGWLTWVQSIMSEEQPSSYAVYLATGSEKKLAAANLSAISQKADDINPAISRYTSSIMGHGTPRRPIP